MPPLMRTFDTGEVPILDSGGVHRTLAVVLAVAIVLTLVGCSADPAPTAGTESSASSTSGGSQTGSTSTTSGKPAGSLSAGALLEARRMAEFTLAPFDVDPELSVGTLNGTGSMNLDSDDGPPRADPEVLDFLLPDPVDAEVDGNEYIAGYAFVGETEGTSYPKSRTLKNIVVRYATATDAGAAVAALVAATQNLRQLASVATSPTDASSIPGHPEAAAVTYTALSGATQVIAVSAREHYALIQSVQATGGESIAAGLVAEALTRQQERIDAFTPTPVDQLESLSEDLSGLVSLTIPAVDGFSSANDGAFGPHGALSHSESPAATDAAYRDAGVEQVVFSKVAGLDEEVPTELSVLQVEVDDGTTRLADYLATLPPNEDWRPIGPADGVSASRCFQAPGEPFAGYLRFYCVSTTKAFVVDALGEDKSNVFDTMRRQHDQLEE